MVADSPFPGSFPLYLSINRPAGSIVVNGPPVTFAAKTPGQGQDFTFTAATGGFVTLNATGGTFQPGCHVHYQILNAARDLEYTGCVGQGTSFSGQVTLPTAGVYTIHFFQDSGDTGHVALMLAANLDPSTVDVNGSPVTFTSTRGGQGQQFIFAASAGEAVTATASGGTFSGACDLTMQFLDPSFKSIGPVACASQSGSLGPTVLPVAGNYRVALVPTNGNAGSVKLRVTA